MAARTISEEVATISNQPPNYCGTIILLELLLEVEFNENTNRPPVIGAPWVYKFEVKFHLPFTLCSIVPTVIGMEASIFYGVLPINSHEVIE